MLTLNDGRSELWQWDTGRTLTVDVECSQVHFSNKIFGRSVDVDVVNGEASIPDILLQTDKDLTAWAFVGTAENGYTKISKVFKVNKRNKPADYVFTPTDQTTLGDILDRIEDLEKRPSGDVSDEDIQNAVNDYLEKNPVSIDEKDPTVPDWAKRESKPAYTAQEVGALPNSVATLPNPHALTIGGVSYDGSEAVEVEIPAGGGGNSISEYPDTPQFDFIVEEDCVSILLDTLNDIPLSDYNFSTMYLIVNNSAVDTATSGALQVRNNYEFGSIRHPIATVNNFIRQTISRWWSVYFNHKEKINFWQTNATARDVDSSTRTGQTYSYDNIYASVVLPITNVYINATEACQIPAGTRIIVWLR